MEPIEYLNGILLLVQISTTLIILTIMGSHYRKTKQKIFILIPLSFIGLFIAWVPHLITFLLFLSGGDPLTVEQHFFIGLIYIPIALLLSAIVEIYLPGFFIVNAVLTIVIGVLIFIRWVMAIVGE